LILQQGVYYFGYARAQVITFASTPQLAYCFKTDIQVHATTVRTVFYTDTSEGYFGISLSKNEFIKE